MTTCVISLSTSSHCVLQYFSWFTRKWKIFQETSTALADWKTEHLEMIKADIKIQLNLNQLEKATIKKDISSKILKQFKEKFNIILNNFKNLIIIAALGGRTGTACLNILSKIIKESQVENHIVIAFLPLKKEERKRKIALTQLKNTENLNNIFIIDLEQVQKLFKLNILDTFSTSDLLATFSIINIIYLLKYHKEKVFNSNSAFFKKSGIGTFSIFDGEVKSPVTKEDYKKLVNWLSNKLLYNLPKQNIRCKLWLLPTEHTDSKNMRIKNISDLTYAGSSNQIILYDLKNKAISPTLLIKTT